MVRLQVEARGIHSKWRSSRKGQKGGQDGYSAVNKGRVEGDEVQKETEADS